MKFSSCRFAAARRCLLADDASSLITLPHCPANAMACAKLMLLAYAYALRRATLLMTCIVT